MARRSGQSGLVVESPDGSTTLPLPVVTDPRQLTFGPDDVVLLAMKSHDTRDALAVLRTVAPADTPIVCVQNGVENERVALRLFPNVYGVSVMCPTGHLTPGVVQAYSAPITGILDLGRYPHGTDATSEQLSAALAASTFSSRPVVDIIRWKYAKLVTNLGNAIEAVCGPPARQSPIGDMVKAEGVACLRAAGIAFATDEEDAARRGDLLRVRPIDGRRREGGSSWQSLTRRVGAIETDYLNGEIVLLGRRHGVPTPANALLQRLANEMAADGAAPGTVSPDEFLARLEPNDAVAGRPPDPGAFSSRLSRRIAPRSGFGTDRAQFGRVTAGRTRGRRSRKPSMSSAGDGGG